MKHVLSFSVLIVMLLACGKDKFQTTPQLKLISVSTYDVPVNGNLKIVLEYTDKQGDVSDVFYIYKQRLNARAVTTVRDSLKYTMPQFPKTQKGEIELNLEYQNDLISAFEPPRIPGSNPPEYEADTLNMKLLVSDKGGNKSDTLVLNNIVIRR